MGSSLSPNPVSFPARSPLNRAPTQTRLFPIHAGQYLQAGACLERLAPDVQIVKRAGKTYFRGICGFSRRCQKCSGSPLAKCRD